MFNLHAVGVVCKEDRIKPLSEEALLFSYLLFAWACHFTVLSLVSMKKDT
jgi:hypothetical protein